MSLCFSLQDAFTVFGEYTDLEWRANTDQIIFKLVALIWTLKDGDPKIRDYTTSTFFNPVLGNVTNAKKQNKTKITSRFVRAKGYYSKKIAFESLYIRWSNNLSTRSIKPLSSSFKTSTFKFFKQDTGQMFIKSCILFSPLFQNHPRARQRFVPSFSRKEVRSRPHNRAISVLLGFQSVGWGNAHSDCYSAYKA